MKANPIPPIPPKPVYLSFKELTDDGVNVTKAQIAKIEPWQPTNIIESRRGPVDLDDLHRPYQSDGLMDYALEEMERQFPTVPTEKPKSLTETNTERTTRRRDIHIQPATVEAG
ncbi:MAG: hypothetical protein O3C63_01865 [Cyanobacteria bacterium]|nr:hypothetical protein [Cyanobacteriota bacterium]